MKQKSFKRGISLVEVVIAMAVVVIMSLAGFSVVNFSLNAGNKFNVESFFVSESQNYISAFNLGEENYSKAIKLLTNQSYTYGENAIIYYSSDFEIVEQANAKYYVNLTFSSSNFIVQCYNIQNSLIFEAEV